MKDILQDVVAHTHSLGFLTLVKVTGEDAATTIESMAEDRSVILTATTKAAVNEFKGTFGMPNLDKLALHLKIIGLFLGGNFMDFLRNSHRILMLGNCFESINSNTFVEFSELVFVEIQCWGKTCAKF